MQHRSRIMLSQQLRKVAKAWGLNLFNLFAGHVVAVGIILGLKVSRAVLAAS